MSRPEKRHQLNTPGGTVNYRIAHRPRITRRMHLELDDEGELTLVVPEHWSSRETHRLALRNAERVHQFLERSRANPVPGLEYKTGAIHLFRGKEYSLVLHTNQRRQGCLLEDETLVVGIRGTDANATKQVLRAWYRQQAGAIFQRRLDLLKMKAPWARDRSLTLALRRMTRTWGTCSRKGVVRLNTHLVKARPECLDFVIQHELCHLQEMNHGPAFYALQEQLCPDWRYWRRFLRQNAPLIMRE